MSEKQCVHCGSRAYVKNGRYKGIQRYVCKVCGRAFSDEVRKFTYADKERFLQLYLNNTGIRKSALFMGCSPSLLVKWVREFASNLRLQLEKAGEHIGEEIPDIIEMDEIFTRVKKGAIGCRYGLLILGEEVRLLPLSLGKVRDVR